MRILSSNTKYLLNELKPILKAKYLRDDIIASFSVVCVAIPLSLAVAFACGVNPIVGLISAIIGGILGAIFGGTRLGVTGPAVAMSVLIANSIETYGFSGLIAIGIICGILQITCGLLKLGRFARIIPLSLVLAFSAGIGFLLFFSQLPQAFQISVSNHDNPIVNIFLHLDQYIQSMNSFSFALALATILILKFLPKLFPKAPNFLIAVAIPTLIVYFGNFHDIKVVGSIPHNLLNTNAIGINHSNWHGLFITACEVFLLASLETLLSANALDLMGKGDLHNPNQELIGQGIANIGVSIFGGIPVTGLIARSSVNILAGAKTRRAAIFQSLIVLSIIFIYPKIIEIIPTAVLAGILLAAAITMINFRQVLELWKIDRLEFAVYLITFIAIVATDLVDGIQTGLFAAFIIAGVRLLKTKTHLKLWANKNVLRVSLTGNITFWSYDKLSQIRAFADTHPELQFVIFEFDKLQNIDVTGAKHLINIAHEFGDTNIKCIFHGLTDEQQDIINSNSNSKPTYSITITEAEIKAILEEYGIEHSANDILKHGMAKFMGQYAKDNMRLLTTLAKGQKPHTLLITCSDSRLNPNAFFSANIGELFIVRNVGNVVPPYNPEWTYSEVAAIEFALNELGVRNIVLCAHTECGAIKASIGAGDVPYAGLNNWLGLIRDGFDKHKPINSEMGVQINVLHQVENLKTYPAVQKLLESKKLTINTWVYDVHSGVMLEWDESKRKFGKAV
jgi:carbonic anhydrase